MIGPDSIVSTSSGKEVGTPRWMAPELLHHSSQSIWSTESDVYAFAMVVVGVFTGGSDPLSDQFIC
jgi:hypothetical protein